jgi:hypothetical protein
VFLVLSLIVTYTSRMSGRPVPGTNDDLMRPPLRYQRFGGGYRREDVELLLAEQRLMLRVLELELGTLRERTHELEGQLRDARTEIDGFRAKGYELARAMSSARDRAAVIEREGEERAAALIAEAETEAARRIDAAERRIAELTGEKEHLLVEMRALVGRVGETIAHEPDTASAAEDRELEPVEEGFPGVDLRGLRGKDASGQESEPAGAEELPTRVELDAGPFADFDAVASFEHALAALRNVEDVYVRRLTGERAVIELALSEAAAIVDEMREHLPFSIEVREREGDRLVLDVNALAQA